MKTKIKFHKLIVSFILIFASANCVHAATYRFYQGGFENRNFVEGYFSGQDLNHDGKLSFASREVKPQDIKFWFTGDASFERLNDLYLHIWTDCCSGMNLGKTVYDIDSNKLSFFWVVELKVAAEGSIHYESDNKFIRLTEIYYTFPSHEVIHDNSKTWTTQEEMQVQAVPIGGALGFFLSGLTGLIFLFGKDVFIKNRWCRR